MKIKHLSNLLILIFSLNLFATDEKENRIHIIKNKIYKVQSTVEADSIKSNATVSDSITEVNEIVKPPIKFIKRPLTIGVGIGFSTLGTDDINELLYDIYAIRLTEDGLDKIPKFEGRLSNSLNFISKVSFDPIRFFSIGLIGKIGFSYDDTDDVISSMSSQDATLYNFSGGITLALKIKAYKNVYPRFGGSVLQTYSSLKITSFAGDVKMSGNSLEGQIFAGIGADFSRLRTTFDFGINIGEVDYSLESTSVITDFPFDYNRSLNLLGFNFAATVNFKLGKR